MTVETPLWMQNAAYPARLDRGLIAAMWDEGVLDGFAVSQRGAGANMSVDVAAGRAIVEGDDESDQGSYLAVNTATVNVAVTAAPGANSRYDLVVLQINDEAAGGDPTNTGTIEVIAGTPSASPSVPSLPPSAIPLAVIGPITTSTTAITDGIISDARVPAGDKVAPGTIRMYAGNVAPSGWLFCDGSAQSRSTYARLFERIGTAFGPGDGATTFNLPNFLNKVGVGAGDTYALGDTGGAPTVTLTMAQIPSHSHGGITSTDTPNHQHSIASDGTHNHMSSTGTEFIVRQNDGNYQLGLVGINTLNGARVGYANTTSTQPNHNHGGATGGILQNHQHLIQAQGGGQAHENMPPFVAVSYIIRT